MYTYLESYVSKPNTKSRNQVDILQIKGNVDVNHTNYPQNKLVTYAYKTVKQANGLQHQVYTS